MRDIERDARADLGFSLQDEQKYYADLTGTEAGYREYLNIKQDTIEEAQDAALQEYSKTFKRWMAIGAGEERAKKKATDIAKKVYEEHMKYFHALFPQAGKKVQKIY